MFVRFMSSFAAPSETARYASNSRIVTSASSNLVASLAMSTPDCATVQPEWSRLKMRDICLRRIHESAEEIKEHAARRADFLFYQMVALHGLNGKYGSQIQVRRGVTVLQHGKGSQRTQTQACHSALFPAIKIETNNAEIGVHLTERFKCTHLYHSLNSTVELPAAVNAFDVQIEGGLRPSSVMLACLAVLNQVANNLLDPASGMNLFYQAMHQFFSASRSGYFYRDGSRESALVKLTIDDLQRKGTFNGADPNLKMLDDYLFLLLRLKPNEIEQVKKDRILLQTHYKTMQDEIWSSDGLMKRGSS